MICFVLDGMIYGFYGYVGLGSFYDLCCFDGYGLMFRVIMVWYFVLGYYGYEDLMLRYYNLFCMNWYY